MTKRLGIINGAHLSAIMAGQAIKFDTGYVEIDDYIRNLIIMGAKKCTAGK